MAVPASLLVGSPALSKLHGPAKEAQLPFGSLEHAKAQFLQRHGGAYGYNGWLQKNWHREYGARLGEGQHYMDWTGAGQYTNSMIAAVMAELTANVYGNPHSRNPSSSKATAEVTLARSLVLQHFNAAESEYYVIFTKGATEGCKMVGEFFPWASGASSSGSGASSCASSGNGGGGAGAGAPRSRFVYTQANHKSILGIGAYAKKAGAELHCAGREQMDQWLGAPAAVSPVPSPSGRRVSHSRWARRVSVITAASASACAGGACGAVGGAEACAVHQQQTVNGGHHHAPPSGPPSIASSGHDPQSASPLGTPPSGGALEGGGGGPTFHLVAYPAKDNYEGQLYPLSWIEQVHAKSDANNSFLVLLDAAAFASTHLLDLSVHKPDFVPVSFYKLFGYPSGLGALLVRKEAARKLNKVYFGGGSVDYCTAEDVWHVLSAPPAGYEDGTLGFLNIAALKHGFKLVKELGGMKAVAAHVETLRSWTYTQLAQLHHSNGRPLIRLFGRHAEGPAHQCAIFQFQVMTLEGDRLPGSLVEAAATAAGLHLRTGCNCNPGRCLANLGITPEEERARAAQGHKGPVLVVMRPRAASVAGSRRTSAASGSPNKLDAAAGAGAPQPHDPAAARALVPVPLPLGSVRASLGTFSTFEDCYALVRFLALTFTNFEVRERDVDAGVKVVNVVDDAHEVVRVSAAVSTAGVRGDDEHSDGEGGSGGDSDEDSDDMLLYSMLTWSS